MEVIRKGWAHLTCPRLPFRGKVYNNERPSPQYDTSPRTIEEHCGRVSWLCLKLKSGGIRCMPPLGNTHATVFAEMVNDPADVVKVGWKLENGNFVWR